MTRATEHLQLISSVAPDEPKHAERSLTPVAVAGPDDGDVVHPATRRRRGPVPTRHEAQARVLGFVADLLGAPDTAGGCVVADVEEAAVLVMRAARDARPDLFRGSVVLAQSAHPAYFTAAATVGLLPLVVTADAEGRAPVAAMTGAVRDDTVLMVASAPTFTHGTVDPIGWLAAAAGARRVPLHVDATCGGWAMAYAERAGRLGPAWGFAVVGVSSVTIDVGPGSGVGADLTAVVHRDRVTARDLTAATLARGPIELPVSGGWPGTALVEAVDTLDAVGHEGCEQAALDALDATAALVDGLVDQVGVRVAARPDATTVTLRADTTCDVFTIADGLRARGWSSQPVLPESGAALLRVPVTAAVLPVVDRLVGAIADTVTEARSHGRARVDATLERHLATLDPDTVTDYAAHLLLDAAATLDEAGDVPHEADRHAATHLLLAAARPGVREALLAVHHERLVRPLREPED